jgi:tetratricopeptide (TPR) repeat protein/DNA-binding CsgD family transcriptional regulator
MKTCKTLFLLTLLSIPIGYVFSQTINPETLASGFLRQFEKAEANNKDSVNLMVCRMIDRVKADFPKEAGLVLCSTGKLLNSQAHDDAALKCLRASLPLISKNKNPDEYIICALTIVDVFYKAMKSDSASYYSDLAQSFSKQRKINKFNDVIYNDKARIADLKGQLLLAIDWYLKAADIQRQKKDSASLGVVLANIGTLHTNLKNYDEAVKYLRESEIYNLHQKNQTPLNDTYINLAVTYQGQNKLSEAVGYSHKSIVLSKKLQNNQQLARVFMNLGITYRMEKKYTYAAAYFDSSTLICEKNNIQVGILLNKINQGQLMVETGQVGKGLALLQDAEKELARYKMPRIQSEFWKIISMGYEKDKQYLQALKYYKKFIELKDSIAGSETNQYVLELQTRYESERSARQIDQLQEGIEKQKAWNRFVLIGLGMAVIIILLLVVLLIFYKRAEKYKQWLVNEENAKLRLSMDVKNQELASKAMNMFKINQIVIDVGNQLKLVLPGLTKEKTDLLQQLLKNLESSLPTEAWKEFETRFEQVHNGFYDKLIIQYPDLSPTELKICGFLRLNLTTKDIALLTNRSIGTIDHSRSSIRRKMNLENDSNLTSYLLSI